MTKLTVNNTRDAQPDPNQPSRHLQNNCVHDWDWNLQNSNDGKRDNRLRHRCLYDIEIVQHAVYINLTAT